MIIAIDGVAGSGKSSTAKKVAYELGFNYFSTGKMYRAITYYCIKNNLVNQLPESIDCCIDKLAIVLKGNNFNTIIINNIDYSENLYSKEINNYVSNVSSILKVRNKMVKIQREVAKNNDIVCEGRDIGTVVFPDADYKFYFKADIRSRVNRRYLDIKSKTVSVSKKKLKNMIKERDFKDINRENSPLIRAKDAILVITTNMIMEEQVNFIVNKIKR